MTKEQILELMRYCYMSGMNYDPELGYWFEGDCEQELSVLDDLLATTIDSRGGTLPQESLEG